MDTAVAKDAGLPDVGLGDADADTGTTGVGSARDSRDGVVSGEDAEHIVSADIDSTDLATAAGGLGETDALGVGRRSATGCKARGRGTPPHWRHVNWGSAQPQGAPPCGGCTAARSGERGVGSAIGAARKGATDVGADTGAAAAGDAAVPHEACTPPSTYCFELGGAGSVWQWTAVCLRGRTWGSVWTSASLRERATVLRFLELFVLNVEGVCAPFRPLGLGPGLEAAISRGDALGASDSGGLGLALAGTLAFALEELGEVTPVARRTRSPTSRSRGSSAPLGGNTSLGAGSGEFGAVAYSDPRLVKDDDDLRRRWRASQSSGK